MQTPSELRHERGAIPCGAKIKTPPRGRRVRIAVNYCRAICSGGVNEGNLKRPMWETRWVETFLTSLFSTGRTATSAAVYGIYVV